MPAIDDAVALVLPAPFAWQRPVLEDGARFKLIRKGRRSGGSRVALHAIVNGHGPNRKFRGLLQGGLVVWIGPSYKQTDAIWREDVRPLFNGLAGVKLNESDYRVEVDGAGTLEVLSARNIDTLRGRGPDGVVCDEGAHWDLEYAWNAVIRPALATKQGWAMFPSTTNRSKDGNHAERMPSYFNVLCLARSGLDLPPGVDAPDLDPLEWSEYHVPTEANPLLPESELDSLYRASGGRESPIAQQELMALLVPGGEGLGFPEWNSRVHVISPKPRYDRDLRYYASLDWGRRQGAYHVYSVDHDGDIEMIWEYYHDFRGMHAFEAAITIFKAQRYVPVPEIIYYDDQMNQDTGVKLGTTLISEWRQGMESSIPNPDYLPDMTASAKQGKYGKTYRQIKKNLMHRYLQYSDVRDPRSGEVEPWAAPKLRVWSNCTGFIREMASLPVSEHDPEDVDTNCPDHAYDSCCLFLCGHAEAPERAERQPNIDTFSHEKVGKPQPTLATEMNNPEHLPEGWGPGSGYHMYDPTEAVQVDA
jgi:hypothetical protein